MLIVSHVEDGLSFVCLFKQKTAYELRISDWSSDVCSSDLIGVGRFDNDGEIGLPLDLVIDAVGRHAHDLAGESAIDRKVIGGDLDVRGVADLDEGDVARGDRKSTRLNSSH